MKKKTMIIYTIIGTILSLIMILLSYFGMIRYLSLHVSGSDKLVENYSKLPKAAEKRVVISLAVNPSNFQKIKPVLNSILDQTVKVDQIGVVVPLNSENDVPEYIKKIANIFPAGKDYGEGTALIPILLKEKECDTIIIALASDVIYGKDFIEKMVDESNEYSGILTDIKRKALLVKPDYYGCEILDSKYNDKWFINQAKKAKIVDYTENFVQL